MDCVENLADVRAENVEITTLGEFAHAVYSNGGGVGASADIRGGKIETSNASAGYGFNKASITYDNTEFNIGGNVYAFMVYTNSTINLNNITKFSNNSGALLYTGDSGALNMSGTTIGGFIVHGASYGTIGALDVVMSGSKWNGYANVADKDALNAKINLTLDKTSLWNVTNDSYTNGALSNAGLINFGEKAEDGFKTVEVAGYKGGADSALVMKTDINNKDINDKLIVSGNAEGKSKVAVYNTKPSGAERSDALIVVKGDSTNVKFEL